MSGTTDTNDWWLGSLLEMLTHLKTYDVWIHDLKHLTVEKSSDATIVTSDTHTECEDRASIRTSLLEWPSLGYHCYWKGRERSLYHFGIWAVCACESHAPSKRTQNSQLRVKFRWCWNWRHRLSFNSPQPDLKDVLEHERPVTGGTIWNMSFGERFTLNRDANSGLR